MQPAWSCDAPETQLVRIADVVVVGPAMLLGAALLPRKHRWLALPLGLMGALTVAYNARNYRIIAARGGEAIPGGRAAGLSPADFDPVQLRAGVAEEMEHTPDARIAQEIAMDHLVEDPRYYDKLRQAGL